MGKTILISSHILPELADLCTSIGIIERGEMIYQGSVTDALRRARMGTVLHIVTPDDQQRAVDVLSKLQAVRSAQIQNGMVIVALNTETSDFSFVASAMLNANLRINEIKQEDVNLETAFMRLTKGIVQ
jgi:ABC-2 type transport system ATP-binding protein